MFHVTLRGAVGAVLLFAVASFAHADVKVSHLFGDNMVFQQGKPLPVWGTAAPGEAVTVTLAGKTATATADDKGNWLVKLPEMPANADGQALSIAGKNTLTFKNVLVGEVWVCSGQSNMEWPVTAALKPAEEISAAKFPQIRLITVPKAKGGDVAKTDFEGQWAECTPDTVKGFSAVAYFFGREIHQTQKVPVGLIHCSWGGQPAEFFTPPSAFAADPSLKESGDHQHAKNVMKEPSTLWNGMIAPLVPFAIQGAIWYQGESNVPMAKHYHKLFSAMIQGWRKEWNQGEFPFLFVQIAPWDYSRIPGWPREGCPLVREAQTKTLALPKTGMTVTMDIGDVNDIHPKNKQEVSHRLALSARKIAYGEAVNDSGPTLKSAEVKDKTIVVAFDNAKGLMMKGDKLAAFQIAGADKKFVDATATLEGETVIVTAEGVAEPKFVRFAFLDTSLPNLFNGDGLPAGPFRTDAD